MTPASVIAYSLRSGPAAGLGAAGDDPAVPFQPGQGRVHLAVGQLPAGPEVPVVGVLQLVTVARLRFEEAEEGAGNVHDADYTSNEYFE